MIGNLYRNGVAGQINLLGTTVNPVRLVWAGGSASLARVCLTTSGPANALEVAPFPAIITREPLGPARALGSMITSTIVARLTLSGGAPVVARVSPERLSGVGGLKTVGGGSGGVIGIRWSQSVVGERWWWWWIRPRLAMIILLFDWPGGRLSRRVFKADAVGSW